MRRMLLISDSGEIVPSPVTESVQIRHYIQAAAAGQKVFELNLQREGFARDEHGGLKAVEPTDRVITTVEVDPFELDADDEITSELGFPVLSGCRGCHDHSEPDIGIRSIQSYSRQLTSKLKQHELGITTDELESMLAVQKKLEAPEWQVLRSLWSP